MNTATKLAAIALVTLVAGASMVQASTNLRTKIKLSPQAKTVECIVQGQPVEFPNDIWVKNVSSAKFVAGKKISYQVPGHIGSHTLVADLNPGQSIFLANVLPFSVEAGKPCYAAAY